MNLKKIGFGRGVELRSTPDLPAVDEMEPNNWSIAIMMTLSGTRKISSPWAVSDRTLMQGDDHRGGGRIMQELSESDKLYIHKQIALYDHYTKLSKIARSVIFEMSRRDCLWRIASCAGLFDDLTPSGTLTENQWNQAIDFVEQFQGGQQ